MKRSLLLAMAVLALVLATLPAGAAPPAESDAPQPAPLYPAPGAAVDGSYIVVLEPDEDAERVADDLAVEPVHVYEHVLTGFSASLDDDDLERLLEHPAVAYVEEDQLATTARHFTQHQPPWNLDRIDQPQLPLDDLYHWWGNPADVNVYVVDTGIEIDHPEFTSRAGPFYGPPGDCNGHGTHVAGVIGALTYGVAKTVKLWDVTVLNCSGSGSYAGIIAATDYVRMNHQAPAVANYSLGGPYSAALNAAISALVQSGVFVTVAAGNNAGDACNLSPASAAGVMTVGATDVNDLRPAWSNTGPCVDVWAPGVNITSTWLGGGTNTISGTSLAAPHAAGVGAMAYTVTPHPFAWILNNASVVGDPNGPYPLVHKANL